MEAVEPPHVGPQLLDGTGTEGVAGGNQDSALVLDQPGMGTKLYVSYSCIIKL